METRKKNLVGKNIRKRRTERNFTQEELALRTGLSQSYINQLESGKRWFSQETLQNIADALDSSMSVLFEEEKEREEGFSVEKSSEKLYQRQRVKLNKKELWSLFNRLPRDVADHYMVLMKLEIDILEGEHLTQCKRPTFYS